MKIIAVETSLTRIPFDMGAKPVSFGGVGWQALNTLWVRIVTDQGLEGWGEGFGHAFDHRPGREVGLWKLRYRLPPTDLSVVGRDLAQAKVAQSIEVVRLGVADRDGLDLGDLHDRRPPSIAPRNMRPSSSS